MQPALVWILLLIAPMVGDSTLRSAKYGLAVDEKGVFTLQGKPYKGIGVNYFDAFARTLKNQADTSYEQGFEALAAHGIPFARFMACGYWPSDNRLYFEDKATYFRLLDAVVASAEKHGIGLIPSLFWHPPTVSDLVREPVDQWGNPDSKTIAFMRWYTKEIVTRYKNSPAIWGWEFGNEFNLAADLPNAAEHRPPVVPEQGTAKTRSERDEVTHAMIRIAFAEFAREVRRHDPARALFSGNGFPRPSARHQKAERSWKQDTPEQYAEMLRGDNPDPLNTLSVHLYPTTEKRFEKTVAPYDLVRTSMETARAAKKPLFVGEFGASVTEGADKARQRFQEILDAVVRNDVPLAALWVYDYQGQDREWNVTATNTRAYQLQMVGEADKRLRSR